MQDIEHEKPREDIISETEIVKRDINRLEKRLRRKGPIAKIYKSVGSQLKEGKKDQLLADIKRIWGGGVSDFIAENIPNKCFDLFTTAAICSKEENEIKREADVYLQRWAGLYRRIGLSNDPVEAVKNFPRYHVGSWRIMYFATALDFFRSLKVEKDRTMNKDQFLGEYAESLIIPTLKVFRILVNEGEDKLWEKADQKLAFLGEKVAWERYLKTFKEDFATNILAAPCLPYYQRRFIIPASESVKLDGEPWGYRCHQAITALEGLAYYRARKRAGLIK